MTQPTSNRQPPGIGFDLPGFVRRRGLMVVLGTLAAALAALIVSLGASESYSADAQVVLDGQSIDERVFPRNAISPENTLYLDTSLAIASLDVLRDETASQLGVPTPDSTEIERQASSNLVNITVTDEDRELVANFANNLASNFIELLREQERQILADARSSVQADLVALPPERRAGDEGEALREQLTNITAIRSLQTGDARLIDLAAVPGGPDVSLTANTIRNVILGGILGLIASIALALLADRTDPRLKGVAELREAFALVLLGRIPKHRRGAAGLRQPTTELPAAEAEAYQLLRSRLQYFNVDRYVTSLLVTSASAGDGKTTVARYLAGAAARAGVRTLLIEADLRRPTLAGHLGLAGAPGLAEVLSGQASADEVVQSAEAAEPDLDVIIAGASPPNPLGLLESDRAGELIQDLSTSYDLVVIDAAPITVVADAFPLVRRVDGVIAVGRVGHTRADQVGLLREQLDELGANVLGMVAVGVTEGGGDDPYLVRAREPGVLDRVMSG